MDDSVRRTKRTTELQPWGRLEVFVQADDQGIVAATYRCLAAMEQVGLVPSVEVRLQRAASGELLVSRHGFSIRRHFRQVIELDLASRSNVNRSQDFGRALEHRLKIWPYRLMVNERAARQAAAV